MQEELVELLIKRNYTITTAESCTGGLISSSIVDVPNASKVFNMAFVVYSNESKINILGVNEKTINKYGVVSCEVVYEMALCAHKKANANISIAVSGIAGPSGNTDTKDIGDVCIGYYINGHVYTELVKFGNIGRDNVRKSTCDYAIKKIIELIREDV